MIKELLNRATIASICAGVLVLMAGIYAFYMKDTNLMTFLAGAGIGFLLKEKVK